MSNYNNNTYLSPRIAIRVFKIKMLMINKAKIKETHSPGPISESNHSFNLAWFPKTSSGGSYNLELGASPKPRVSEKVSPI